MAQEVLDSRESSASLKEKVSNMFTEMYGFDTIKICGTYDVSINNTYPSTGGSGTSGSIQKGDCWVVSATGVLYNTPITKGTTLISLSDAPGQTITNWLVGGMPIGDSGFFSGEKSYQIGPNYTQGVGEASLEFLNIGNVGINPSEDRHLVPGGVFRHTGSIIMGRNMRWNNASSKYESVYKTVTGYGANCFESGGEGASTHAVPYTDNFSDVPSMGWLVSGNGPRGVPGYTSGYVNQSQNPLYIHWATTSYQTGKLRSWNPSTATDPLLRLHGEEAKGTDNEFLALEMNAASASAYPAAYFAKSRGSYSSKTTLATSDVLGCLGFKGYDGDEYHIGGMIRAVVNGSVSNNTLPTQLEFQTTATNTGSLTTRMTILPNGNIIMHALPTSSAGLATGTLWNNSGVINVA